MAMSLEDLLAEDGFRRRRTKMLSRASSGSETASMARHSYRDQPRSGSSSGVKKTERAKSDISRYSLGNDLAVSNGIKGRRPRDNLIKREKLGERLEKETEEKFERVSNDLYDVSRLSPDSSKDFLGNEIVEVGVEDGEEYKDIYSNRVYSPERSKGKYSDGLGERERPKRRSGKDIKVDQSYGNNSNNHPLRRMSFSDIHRKSLKQPETSYSRSNRSLQNRKGLDDSRSRRRVETEKNVAEPPLDEVAVQAIISILSGYIKRFLKDESFRTSLHHNCFSLLNFAELEEGLIPDNKAIVNLEQAIETIERAAEECASARELKKASLKLSVITGLNSSDMRDGFTSGIPNCKLSACAHLYLSVVYKLQKKDRVAAKHILQVFCDSPFEARTTLLPELWDYIILPHLSHLNEWYNQEADSLADTPSKSRKLMLLEKVYNEIMDSGTYQFAVYYKDWLTEGIEYPSIPSIHVPSISVQGVRQAYAVQRVQQEGLFSCSEVGSPTVPFSPQPMVSKKLYDTVFGRAHKPGANEIEDYKGAENFDEIVRSSDGSDIEDKQPLTCSSAQEDGLIDEQVWKLHQPSAPGEGDTNDKFNDPLLYPENPENTQIFHSLPHSKPNELILRRIAQSVFEQQTERPSHLADSTLLPHMEDALYPDSFANPVKMRFSDEELDGNYENFDEGSSCPSIPQDFICPLTGLLFEDPVTLETGETFERASITEWFNQGNRTCPVTGKRLECQSVPFTNFILKRLIDKWKSEHCRHLFAFASQAAREHRSELNNERSVFLLEQLLTAFSKEERITNAKLIISLGGLEFLVRRFESGNLEEKTRVVALFSSCIEADARCRSYIASNIRKPGLIELIHSKQVKSRVNAVLLLIELICLNRRKDVNLFLSGLQNEGILDTMHALLVYLQSSPPEQRPLVALLLLHLDLLVEPRRYSIYREEAVDAISVALDGSLSNEKIQANCCRALLILGGRFSSSGKIMIEDWILKQTGFLENEDDDAFVDKNILSDDEEEEREGWLRTLSASLVRGGKKSFLESISNCLGSGNLDLVRVSLTTVAWLSAALASFSDSEFQLSAFSALITRLKDSLESSERVEHKILVSISLLNFSKIPECRVLLMKIAKEIAVPLRSLAEVTWTAKELYAIISGEDS